MALNLDRIDLGSFGLNEESQEQTQLNANMTEAVKVNPDQFAQTAELSRQSGIPEFAVQSNPEQVQQKLDLDQIDLEGMTTRAPATAKFLAADMGNSVIAQEDVLEGVLEGIEETFRGLGESIKIGFKTQAAGFELAGTDATPDHIQDLIPASALPIGMEFDAQMLSQELASNLGIETDEQLIAAKQEASDRLIGEVQRLQEERQTLTPEDLNLVQEGVRAGVESLANMAPGVGLMLLSGGRATPLLATIGVQTFTGSYASGRAEGLTPEEARWFAGIDAAIEVGTELLPIGTIERVLTGGSTGLKKDALKFIVQEMGTEQLATVLQTLNSFMFDLDDELNNAQGVQEVINIQLRRQAITAIATVVAGGTQIAAATTINKTIAGLTEAERVKETQGDIEQRSIDRLNADSEKSKLRERDVESFKQFVREADGENNTHVFIDSVQTSLYLQSKTREEIESDRALKVLDNAVRESRVTGVDAAIQVDDFAGDVAGTEHFNQLRDSMTMSEETISPFRQEQHREETQNYVNTLMDEAQENVSEYVEAQEIYTTVRDQLIDSGTVNATNASVMAQVIPAWATAQARRTGRTVADVYESAGLVIEGPQTGERARLEGEQVLSQQPAFREAPLIFESARDKFLEELPEDAEVDEVLEAAEGFGTEYKNFIKALERDEWLGFDFPSQAISAALSGDINDFDPSRGLKSAIGRMVNVEFDSQRPFAQQPVQSVSPVVDTRDAKELQSDLFKMKGVSNFTLSTDINGVVSLDNLQIRTDERESGLGTEVMNELVKWADQNGKTIALTPSNSLGGSVRRLKPFYKRFGFVENKGKNKDFEISESMFREPQQSEGLRQAQVDSDVTITKMPTVTATEAHTDAKEMSEKTVGALAKVEGSILASSMASDYKKHRVASIVGQDVPTINDMAIAAQVYRNPSFETLRYFFVKDDVIVGQTGVTSRLPGETRLFPSEQDLTTGVNELKLQMKRVGADGYYMMHNHPSGNINPSAPDINSTQILASEMDGFLGHIVVNETQYASIDIDGNSEVLPIDNVNPEYDLSKPAKSGAMIGTKVTGPSVFARAGTEYYRPDWLTIIGRQGSAGNISGIGEFPKESLQLSELKLKAALRSFMIQSGSSDVALVNVPEEMINNVRKFVESGDLLDAITVNGTSVRQLSVIPSQKAAKAFKALTELDGVLAQTPPDTTEARGYYDPANSIIRLTESADLSTFLHEFAHFMYEMEAQGDTDMNQNINSWYKRNAEDVAKEAGTYAPNTTIIPRHVVAFLDTGTAGDKERDVAIRRAVHEQFARGFETYLMEGKAPSIELRNAFRTFARWLSQIYQSLRGGLRVNLDPEMRAVFDRLLATEEQIAAAESRARVEPMFTSAAMVGMTDEEFTDYQKRQEKVKDVQSETLRDQLIKQLTRQTKQWWKAEKQDLIDEELERLSSEQVYSAAARLRDGDIKLDHATVKAMVGEERTNKLGRTSVHVPAELRGMTAKGQKGVHPDEAAAFFGYSSGAELLNALITTPKIKVTAEANAQARMIERHGDVFTDGTIEQQADEAVQNEERGKLILHELKILARGTNQRTLDRQTMKSIVQERVGELSFREIHPGKYRKAEIRAAQESSRMLAEGNKEGAAQAKARQALNYYLGMAATEARNETTKIVDRMARYNKKKVREGIQKAGGGYWEQIVKILERFEFRKSATLKTVDQVNQDINTWANERMGIDGDGLVLSNAVLNESFITHWKNVAFSDLQGINDSVKNIEHVARYANKLTRMGEEIEFNKLVERLVSKAEETGTGRFKRKASTADDVSWFERKGRWAMAQMTKIPFMMSWMDGGERVGTWFNTFSQPMTDAYDAELKMFAEIGKPVAELINNRSKEDMIRHNTIFFIPEIKGTANGTHTGNLKGHEIIAVALNTGNAGNLRKLLLGEGWANPDNDIEVNFDNPKLQAVLSHLTKSDWDMVQSIWDQLELLYPQLSEVHRRTTGLTPPKIESTPITNEFGTFKGGYYPVKYDPTRDTKAAENEERRDAEVSSMFSNNASIQASVNAGATNERTGYFAPIHLTLNVVPNHIQETIHYITHHDAVREANRLLRDPRVRKAVTEKLGPEEYAQLKPWLNDIAKDGRNSPSKTLVDAVFNKLRLGTTLGVMGFKASTGIIQISGLSNSIAELGLKPVLQSMRTVLGSVDTMKSAWGFAVENSKVLSHRTQTMDREIKNAMKQIEGKRGVLPAVQEASMKHIALIQTYMVDLPSWHAAYIKEMSESGDEVKAFQYADWVIENVQGSGATKDMAALMRNQSKTHTIFTMFMTFFSSLWNMQRDLVKGAKSGLYSHTTIAAKLMFLFTVPVIFEMMMRGEFAQDDDDDETALQKMLTSVAMYPIQSIPVVRDIANGLLGDYNYNASPVSSMLEQGLQGSKGLSKALLTDKEITKGQVKSVSKLVGATLGIPGTAQAWATGEHLHDVIVEGEELTMHQLLFGPKR